MKTPHLIYLYPKKSTPQYNPVTGEYESTEGEALKVSCLINRISQSKVFEEYGNRTEAMIACRFSQEQKPFVQAKYQGDWYEPVETIDAPIKGSVRLRKVVE